jgi:hypothetical protein
MVDVLGPAVLHPLKTASIAASAQANPNCRREGSTGVGKSETGMLLASVKSAVEPALKLEVKPVDLLDTLRNAS